MIRFFRQTRAGRWMFTATVIVVVMVVFRTLPDQAERVYGSIMFPLFRCLQEFVPLPFSGMQLMLLLYCLAMVHVISSFFSGRLNWRKRLTRAIRRLMVYVSVLIIWFYLFWGYNYARPDLMERMDITEAVPDTAWLFTEIDSTIRVVNELRRSTDLTHLDHLTAEEVLSTDYDIDEINRSLELVLEQFKYKISIDPEVKFIQPDGFLLHWSTAGIYWPFTGESNVDKGVHYIRKPVTIAHELAHAHGLTSEGDCNFVAYLAARSCAKRLYQYSAHLSYLGYLMRDALKILGRDRLDRFYDQMSDRVKRDRQAIFDHHNSYEDYLPSVRNAVYDSYLKTQGVKGGLDSYNYFVNLKYQFDR